MNRKIRYNFKKDIQSRVRSIEKMIFPESHGQNWIHRPATMKDVQSIVKDVEMLMDYLGVEFQHRPNKYISQKEDK